MDNKFKPIQRPTYGGQQNGAAPYSRPISYNNAPQQPSQEYQQPPMQEPIPPEDYGSPMPMPKKGVNKKLILGIVIGVVVIALSVLFITTKNKGNVGDVPNVLESTDTNSIGEQSSLLANGQTNTGFNGSAVEVPWPSDITPTKMEINLDPTTGEPVLMLVGEKSGVGTVIRSYNKAGSLTGFWVIVSSDPAMTDTTAAGNSNTNTNNNGTTTTGSTPTLEQTIADEVYTYVGTDISGLTTDDIIKKYNKELTATATKYGKTVEEVLNYYLSVTGLSPATSTSNNSKKTTTKKSN